MSPRKMIIVVFLLLVAMSSTVLTSVDAARRLGLTPEEQYSATVHATSTTLHERARSLITTWMAQLTAGPSPRGPGH
ncbi:uncharacterized protein LOC123430468 [Hordeum vulgare subsp. vulgare]|uniref:Uncharacterized protein n=1 Tax=Hordeum vulgare subsp. vulgare TaxID=112509 RepID=A0A8I6X9P7_HORVV|nr:uncharacterized protein LOC123430468 [Hordeum vulgare subsp. vulgare]